MNQFNQRSSLPSSFLTGLIGWIGWMVIGPLMFGFQFSSLNGILIAIVSAVVQISFLRLLFFKLQMHKHLLIGIIWGSVTVVIMYFLTGLLFTEMEDHYIAWLLIYIYIGAPVGGFLSYFYIDDKKIFDAAGGKTQDTDFGRDAHWMEPFGFGVVAYLIAFIPFTNVDLAINVIIVGAISGVAAAGASHFSPDNWKRSFFLITLIVLAMGIIQGTLTGLLFRAYTEQLYTNHIIHGIIGAVLTYTITFLRGRQLAAKEANGQL